MTPVTNARDTARRDRHHTATIDVRDSKHTSGPRLALTPDAWTHFVAYASEG
ncbi:DUF397 domain-containing protein [Streptomyces sp. NPDC001410]|uniref:DUF397 domain-containing protein n=1 Tax=Streptomyces sp. NPDC001410 TaxID=3364574 RepID=UPI00367BB26B